MSRIETLILTPEGSLIKGRRAKEFLNKLHPTYSSADLRKLLSNQVIDSRKLTLVEQVPPLGTKIFSPTNRVGFELYKKPDIEYDYAVKTEQEYPMLGNLQNPRRIRHFFLSIDEKKTPVHIQVLFDIGEETNDADLRRFVLTKLARDYQMSFSRE